MWFQCLTAMEDGLICFGFKHHAVMPQWNYKRILFCAEHRCIMYLVCLIAYALSAHIMTLKQLHRVGSHCTYGHVFVHVLLFYFGWSRSNVSLQLIKCIRCLLCMYIVFSVSNSQRVIKHIHKACYCLKRLNTG